MEYQANIDIQNFPRPPEQSAESLLDWLAAHSDTGPVISLPAGDNAPAAPVSITLATVAESERAASTVLLDTLATALAACGLERCYPAVITITADPELAVA